MSGDQTAVHDHARAAAADAIMSGDLHTTTARMVYGDPTIDKKDPRRQPAKSSGFAKVYGAGLEQFAAHGRYLRENRCG